MRRNNLNPGAGTPGFVFFLGVYSKSEELLQRENVIKGTISGSENKRGATHLDEGAG